MAGLWKLEGNRWLELMKLAKNDAKPNKITKYTVRVKAGNMNTEMNTEMQFDNEKRMKD